MKCTQRLSQFGKAHIVKLLCNLKWHNPTYKQVVQQQNLNISAKRLTTNRSMEITLEKKQNIKSLDNISVFKCKCFSYAPMPAKNHLDYGSFTMIITALYSPSTAATVLAVMWFGEGIHVSVHCLQRANTKTTNKHAYTCTYMLGANRYSSKKIRAGFVKKS